MRFAEGTSRYQTRIACRDDDVEPESTARLIDRFVDGLDLAGMGFKNAVPKELGRKPINPAYMAKLFIYGYEDGTRSSRKLERLTNINVEVMWLMEEQKPDFKTIADFRKDNIGPLTELLSEFNSFADYCGLFGKGHCAIDGMKIRASNNRKNNFNKKKLERNIEYNKRRIEEYLSLMAESDDMDEACTLAEKIDTCEKRIEKANGHIAALEESGESEISTVDPDARMMGSNNFGVDMAYNVQASVDGKAHLVAAFDVTQSPNDHGQLGNMVQKTQEVLRKKEIMALGDKGYYSVEGIEKAEQFGAIPVIARQLKPGEKNGSRFSIDKFVYDKEKDEYICPEGKSLPAHSKNTTKDRIFFNKAACRDCLVRNECLNKEKYRRIVRRPQNDVLDRADKRYAEHKKMYKLRQEIVEHVFGSVKRTMDGGYFLLRRKEKVKAEAGLLFLGYNIKRTKSCLGFERTMEMLDEWYAFLCERGSAFCLSLSYSARAVSARFKRTSDIPLMPI